MSSKGKNVDDENNRWIESRLTASFSHLDLPASPPPGRYQAATPRWRRKRMSLLAGLPAILTTKVAAAAAIALTAAGGGVVTKTVLTGNPNPVNWGSTVTQQVQSCKAALTTGQHGIGACVSSVASQHGQQQRQAHAPATSTQHAGKSVAHPTHPVAPPPSHPTGPPSGHTTGPPSGAPHPH
jgi:hypothetical protein